jgi:hypothetical protein
LRKSSGSAAVALVVHCEAQEKRKHMRRLLYVILLGAFAAPVCFGQAFQAGPVRTGFAVVTPITGGTTAFSVTETLLERLDGSIAQSSVEPSPLVTSTSIVLVLDPAAGLNTGVAFLNPFGADAVINLSLVNQGVIISAKTIIIRGSQQLARFVTDLFAGVPQLQEPFAGRLLINSSVPVSVLALSFNGPFFTTVPITQVSEKSACIANPNSVTGFTLGGIPVTDLLLFPQVVAGGGWLTNITVANTSALPQSIRIDVFDSTGALLPLSGLSTPNTIIQPGGVVIFSTARNTITN